jgi:hypothetical protein
VAAPAAALHRAELVAPHLGGPPDQQQAGRRGRRSWRAVKLVFPIQFEEAALAALAVTLFLVFEKSRTRGVPTVGQECYSPTDFLFFCVCSAPRSARNDP